MNTLTIHGNLTDDPQLRHSTSGRAVTTFSVAVNRRRYDRDSGQWTPLAPVFHRVVAFGALAANAAATLAKGTAVAVTGELADDSYTHQDGRTIRGIQLQASDVAVSLRYATATLTTRRDDRDQPTTDNTD